MERSPYLDDMMNRHLVARRLGTPSPMALHLHTPASVGVGSGNFQHVMHWDTPELPAAALAVPGGLQNAIRNTWGLIR
jgi:hypothetical protein